MPKLLRRHNLATLDEYQWPFAEAMLAAGTGQPWRQMAMCVGWRVTRLPGNP
jgi:hypothetical protein